MFCKGVEESLRGGERENVWKGRKVELGDNRIGEPSLGWRRGQRRVMGRYGKGGGRVEGKGLMGLEGERATGIRSEEISERTRWTGTDGPISRPT